MLGEHEGNARGWMNVINVCKGAVKLSRHARRE